MCVNEGLEPIYHFSFFCPIIQENPSKDSLKQQKSTIKGVFLNYTNLTEKLTRKPLFLQEIDSNTLNSKGCNSNQSIVLQGDAWYIHKSGSRFNRLEVFSDNLIFSPTLDKFL